jgi:hypothetical protein
VKPSTHPPITIRFLRHTLSVVLVLCAFVILGRVADRTLVHFARAGVRGPPSVALLVAAAALAYATFTGIIYFVFPSRRPLVYHGVGAGITLVWLVLLLAWSTPTEPG